MKMPIAIPSSGKNGKTVNTFVHISFIELILCYGLKPFRDIHLELHNHICCITNRTDSATLRYFLYRLHHTFAT